MRELDKLGNITIPRRSNYVTVACFEFLLFFIFYVTDFQIAMFECICNSTGDFMCIECIFHARDYSQISTNSCDHRSVLL